MSWSYKLAALKLSGRVRCECLDCLRAAGITPERSMMDRHPDCLGRRFHNQEKFPPHKT